MGAEKKYIHENYRTSVHEAGHAVVALAVGINVERIENRAPFGGDVIYNLADIHRATDFDQLTKSVAGTVSERLWYRDDRPINGAGTDYSDFENVKAWLSGYPAWQRDKVMADATARAEKGIKYNSHIFDRFLDELLNSKQINQSTINRILNHQKLWKV